MTILKVKDLRQVIGIGRISMCKMPALEYDNFRCMDDVPAKYDEMYVVRINIAHTEVAEFLNSGQTEENWLKNRRPGVAFTHADHIEIIVAEAVDGVGTTAHFK